MKEVEPSGVYFYLRYELSNRSPYAVWGGGGKETVFDLYWMSEIRTRYVEVSQADQRDSVGLDYVSAVIVLVRRGFDITSICIYEAWVNKFH